ncbi:hypothetical protein I5515_12795 [Acinetobacter calcoaceticus]|uniref:hypothetical protein n=1 Tax=Acinetobacter calcoaceticus TaxID=471 RepID=UPI00190145C0|nr:hypothetical protein [Acinetobacter calcoaceticus]MBJ9722681.1 hypothetical protein [Acinetobacter calcoaceticus]
MKIKDMSKIKLRNQVALSPLLQKGGMHETEKPRAQHRKDRQDTRQLLRKGDW